MGCMAEIPDEEEVCSHCGYQKDTRVTEAYYLLPGRLVGEKYLIGRVIGYGGFGVTYLGWDTKLERKVAVKEYLPSDFATRSYGAQRLTVFSGEASVQFQAGLESFLAEARRLAGFRQIPEIVDIYDCFMENGTGYIVMEYLEGKNVKEILKNRKTLPVGQAQKICSHVLRGLAAVHKEGMIHRDIAPDNIFITRRGEVKLIDFGAARYATAVQSRSLSVILKPGYAPEEQYRSRGQQGPWTDVYATGATFYRMITGVLPQPSIERLAEDHLKKPSELGVELPQSVENALMNSLNVKQENRIQDAMVFCEVLCGTREMERMEEEKQKKESGRIPPAVKAVAGASLVLASVCLVLLLTGRIRLTRKTIGADEGIAALDTEECYVPDVSGMSYEEAENLLAQQGLKVLIDGMNYSEKIEKDRILSQTPGDGAVIRKNENVYVVMSGGTQEVMMPDLVGLTRAEAETLVKAQNLALDRGQIEEEYSDFVEKGRVTRQSVEADTRVSVKTEVAFCVSLGNLSDETAVLAVPDLVGLTREEALEHLRLQKEEEGFTYIIGESAREYSAEVEKGRIIRQSPAAGSRVRTDQPLSLVISNGPELATVPELVYKEKSVAAAELEEAGFAVKTDSAYSDRVAEGLVISQSAEAGTQAAKGSQIVLTVSLGKRPVNSRPVQTPADQGQDPAAGSAPADQGQDPAAGNAPPDPGAGSAPSSGGWTPPPAPDNSNPAPDDDVPVMPDDDVPVMPDDDIPVMPDE